MFALVTESEKDFLPVFLILFAGLLKKLWLNFYENFRKCGPWAETVD